MNIKLHEVNHHTIAEVIAEGIILSNAEEGLDLLGNLFFQGISKVILHAAQVTPAFFDLKNGMAGEVLQKFTNYRVQLAIVGDFSQHTGKSIRDFIFESNQGRQVNFLSSTEEALQRLS